MKSALRRAWRASRSRPLIGQLAAAADRLWWLRLVLRSGLVDAEYYAAQRGSRARSVLFTSAHYVTIGFRRALSANPMCDERYASRKFPDSGRVPALYAYLVSDTTAAAVHPWLHLESRLEALWAEQDTKLEARIGRHSARYTVAQWRRAAVEAVRSEGANAPSPATRVIVVRVLETDPDMHQKIAHAVDAADERTAVVVAYCGHRGSAWATAALSASLVRGTASVSAVRAAGSRVRSDMRDLADHAAGATVAVVTDPRAEVTTKQLGALASGGVDAVVAPVVLASDGTIAGIAAGVVRTTAGRRIAHVLGDHPAEDLAPLQGAVFDIPSFVGGTFAAPAEVLRRSLANTDNGDESVALSVAAHDAGVPVRVDTGIVVGPLLPSDDAERAALRAGSGEDDEDALASMYRAAGFEVLEWRAAAATATAVASLRRSSERQRWALKTCAPAGPVGQVWGDTHFAQGLAKALRRLGHEVVVDAFDAAHRSTTYLDDVSVVIRGPFRIAPQDTGINIEWIISHPDDIDRDEVSAFDLVYAVSPGWAERASREWGVSIEPLMEATDADLFAPQALPRGHDVVFVGTARGIARPAVVAPLKAGIDVHVYGPDWGGFVPARAIAAPTIRNDELPELYETASVVLNDHWPAMRREGFMAMRPFDVVAAGGRVISEFVPLLDDVFEGAVVTFGTEQELIEMLRGDVDGLFPPPARLAEISARIRRDHSFDARACVLSVAVKNRTSSNG